MTHRPRLGAAVTRPEPAPTVNRTQETAVNQPETSPPAVWIDGHPQLEAIANAVWAQCSTEGTSLVVDDPRNIAVAALAAITPAPAEAVLERARSIACRLAAHAVGFQDVLDDSDRDPWAKSVRADIAALSAVLDEAAAAPSADRAAVLLWAADQIDAETRRLKADGVLEPDKYRPCRDASTQLRDLAAEARGAQQDEAAPDGQGA